MSFNNINLGLIAASLVLSILPIANDINAQTKIDDLEIDMIRISAVNHLSIDIFQQPDIAWKEVLNVYLSGNGFAEIGYLIEPLTSDPAAFRGGYQMTMFKDNLLVDDRLLYVTERDDTNMRLSLFADYLSPAFNKLKVNTTFQLLPIKDGVRYEIHAYSQMYVPQPDGSATQQNIAKMVIDFEKQADNFLKKSLQRTKLRIEALSR